MPAYADVFGVGVAKASGRDMSGRHSALWRGIDQKAPKLNIFVPNRQKLKKFVLNTLKVCLDLMPLLKK